MKEKRGSFYETPCIHNGCTGILVYICYSIISVISFDGVLWIHVVLLSLLCQLDLPKHHRSHYRLAQIWEIAFLRDRRSVYGTADKNFIWFIDENVHSRSCSKLITAGHHRSLARAVSVARGVWAFDGFNPNDRTFLSSAEDRKNCIKTAKNAWSRTPIWTNLAKLLSWSAVFKQTAPVCWFCQIGFGTASFQHFVIVSLGLCSVLLAFDHVVSGCT